MLRYFYILICIVVFSNDFTESSRPKCSKVRANRKHNAEEKLVLLDMESFMNSDDDPQDYEPFDVNSKLTRGTQNEEYYDSPIKTFKREENADYSYLKEVNNGETVAAQQDDRALNEQILDGQEKENKLSAAEEGKADISIERRAVQDPTKKCLFQNMKIPFFSHKTTKQHKRRKLECLNCGEVYTNEPDSQANEKVNLLVRRLKRTYGNVCPNCIRHLLQRFHKKQITNPLKPNRIHNSKKKYPIMANLSRRNKMEGNNFEYSTIDEQTKRKADKERQFKELAEVEMKVQNVEVTTSKASGRLMAVTKL